MIPSIYYFGSIAAFATALILCIVQFIREFIRRDAEAVEENETFGEGFEEGPLQLEIPCQIEIKNEDAASGMENKVHSGLMADEPQPPEQNGAQITQPYVASRETFSAKSDAILLLKISVLAVISRLSVFWVTLIAHAGISNKDLNFFSSFEGMWRKWDVNQYIGVAERLYASAGDHQLAIVFYPLYPILIRVLNGITNNSFWSGMLISNVCFIFACFYLYKLVKLEFKNEGMAFAAVKYCMIIPLTFFFSIVYTEGLFLMLTVMCFYYMRTDRWLLVGITGFLCALTRNYGVLLAIPAVIELLLHYEIKDKILKAQWIKAIQAIVKKGYAILFIPAGTFVYLCINKILFNDWFKFLEFQKDNWHHRFYFFADTFKEIAQNSLKWQMPEKLTLWGTSNVVLVLSIIILFIVIYKMRSSYAFYTLGYLFLTFSISWLISGPRYFIGLFPLFIVMAYVSKNKMADFLLTLCSTLLLAVYAVFFIMSKQVL